MRITSIDFHVADLELKRPYAIAYKSVDSVENVIVTIRLENGITGMGTANPSKYVVGEDVKDTVEVLELWDKELLLHQDIRELYHCLHLVHSTLRDHIGARVALDIALHDAFCRWQDIPLARFLGQRIECLPTSITIGIKNVEDTLKEAEEYVGSGFLYLKVKLGKSPEEDIERVVKLREQFGEKIHIRVDANQGYSREDLLHFYKQIRALEIELIEQPLPVKESGLYKELPREIRKIIAADESLVNARDAFKLAVPPASCGIFNIKLMKCGGILPAQHITTVAKVAGMDLMWGCNDESVISIAAALHVALSCPETRYLDLDGSLDLAKDVAQDAFIIKEGIMFITDRPGLGWKK